MGVGEDRRSAGEMSRCTVEEAAAVLGMTTGAVRNRLSKGILRSVEEHGAVYVLFITRILHIARCPPMIPATCQVCRVVRPCPRCASG